MQPTVIKIKFTPIIRHLQKENTKCCLEIVPDVSCIQNLDKIDWNDDSKVVEYSVPVTYKIILKRDINEETIGKEEKIYYSCVDLRFLSTNSLLACGDVSKVFSDNVILSKVTADFESHSAINEETKIHNNITKSLCPDKQDSANITEELDKLCLITLATKEGDKSYTAHNNIGILPDLRQIDDADHKTIAKQIFTECTMSKETITDISNKASNNEKKRKLTITSVCTLNTIDNPANGIDYDNAKKNNNKICTKYKSKNKIDYKINKVTESFTIHRSLYSEDNVLRINKASRGRILPELRVAHFMMSVENEILPLKILLSEIYRKCASLGLLWKQTNTFSDSVPTFCPIYSDKIKFLNYNEKKPKCNRVVYSIVFEE